MNENLINEISTIIGKTKSYMPFAFATNVEDNYSVENSIAVFSEPTDILTRANFKVDFYENFTKKDFLNSDRSNQTVYFIKSSKEESISIIEDIKAGEFFRP